MSAAGSGKKNGAIAFLIAQIEIGHKSEQQGGLPF